MDARETFKSLSRICRESMVSDTYKNYIRFITWKIERDYKLDMEKKVESVREN